MSQPTQRPGGWSQLENRRRHHAGDHTQCRPGWCLAARADRQAADLSATLDQLQADRDSCPGRAGRGYAPASTPVTPVEPQPCGICGGLIEHVTTGPDAPWWRHLGSITGPPHSAQPGDES